MGGQRCDWLRFSRDEIENFCSFQNCEYGVICDNNKWLLWDFHLQLCGQQICKRTLLCLEYEEDRDDGERWKILMSANWSLYLFFFSFGLDLCFDVSLSRPSRFDVHISKPKIDRRKFSFSSWNTKLKDRNSRSWLGSQNRLLVRLALFDTLVFL